ncbi:MAG TPA: hypothetical protein VGS01_05235 [Candidatus Limnocylindria bacterium]|jgi:hypothetical protein|nr:hypothetical protein [Candidatus Limnocylindria bacterium]
MATSLTDNTAREDWADTSAMPGRRSLITRAEWLWTLVGLALLGGAFLSLVIDDLPLRTIISVQ